MSIETIELIKVDEKMIIILRAQDGEVRKEIKGTLGALACVEFDELKEKIKSMDDVTE